MKKMTAAKRRRIAQVVAIVVVAIMVLSVVAPFIGTGAFANM